jgi:hypothetical protein
VQARVLYEEALTIWRRFASMGGIADALGNLGAVDEYEGEYVFNRIWAPPVGDGTVQTHFGAAALNPGTDTAIFLAGVFYHNGLGPFPWTATGYHVG